MSRPAPPGDVEQPFLAHLLELRTRLLRALGAVVLLVCVLMPFANDIYTAVALPLMQQLPQGSSMIATEVASTFIAPFKLTAFVALFLAMPLVLYQVWAFVAPGLYENEQRFALPLLVSSTALFYLGAAFAYYVVFPLIFGFFTAVAPAGVMVMTDISRYLDFVLTMFFAFGVTFEIPVAIVLLVRTGMVERQALIRARPYIIVGAFVIAAILTPPDVVSQCLMALPMWGLYEIGLQIARLITPRADATPAARPS